MNTEQDFYKNVLENIPALVYVNEFTEMSNYGSLVNVWSNRFAIDFIGYSQDEITKLGFDFFSKILHPDDLEIIKATAAIPLPHKTGNTFTYMQRIKPKGKTDYLWMYGNGTILELYENGYPKKSLNVVVEISHLMHTENQLMAALKEINWLHNKVRCQSLTKREKEILNYIAKGYTDKDIGEKLFISVATAKTHRNNLIKKLCLKNTASLAAFAAECGIN
jgi:DNA-binding CsgD family transcriptional regulator